MSGAAPISLDCLDDAEDYVENEALPTAEKTPETDALYFAEMNAAKAQVYCTFAFIWHMRVWIVSASLWQRC